MVGQIIANDSDGDDLTFSLESGNTNNAFSLNEFTGELTVNNQIALNLDLNPGFTLLVSVSDGFTISTAEIEIALIEVITSSENAIDTEISIFPNPVSHYLEIKNTGRDIIDSISVSDLTGKNHKVSLRGNQVDLSTLRAGAYQVAIRMKSGKFKVFRILKY